MVGTSGPTPYCSYRRAVTWNIMWLLLCAGGEDRMLCGTKVLYSLLTTSSRRLCPTVHTAFTTFQPANLGASFKFTPSYWCSFKVRTGISAVGQAVRTLKPDHECAQTGMLPAVGARFPFPCTLVVSSLLV